MKSLNFVGEKNELLEAMVEISKYGYGPSEQFSSADVQ